MAYNKKNKITPTSIKKSIQDILSSVYEADYVTVPVAKDKQKEFAEPQQVPLLIKQLRKRMKDAATRLDFEEAAELAGPDQGVAGRGIVVEIKNRLWARPAIGLKAESSYVN